MLEPAELPPGVTRSRDISQDVALDNCHAIQFYLEPEGDGAASSLIVWRDGPKHTRPLDKSKRLRELRRGDALLFKGRTLTIREVEIYR